LILVTAIAGRPKPETILPQRVRWMTLSWIEHPNFQLTGRCSTNELLPPCKLDPWTEFYGAW